MDNFISIFTFLDNEYDEIIKKNKLDISDICEYGFHTYNYITQYMPMMNNNKKILLRTYYIELKNGLIYEKEKILIEEGTQDE